MNFFSALSKFSIRKQILLGYLPIIIMLAVLVFNSQQKYNTFSQNFEKLALNTKENQVFLEIERDMKELERSVLAYSYVGYEGVLMRITKLQNTIEKKFEKVETVVNNSDKTRDRFERLLGHYESYTKAFQTVIKEQRKMNGILNEQLKPNHQKILEMLEEMEQQAYESENKDFVILSTTLQNKWRQISLNIGSFQTTTDASVIRATTKLIDSSRARLDAAEIEVEYKSLNTQINTLKELSKDYKKTYLALVNTNRTYIHLINVVLAGKAAEIDRLLKELDQFSEEQSLQLSKEILNNNISSHINFILISVIVGFIGVVFAWLIAYGISTPVTKMTSTLTRLANGDFNTTIPAVDRGDEVGQMAKAADAFKNMAYEINEKREEIEDTRNRLETIVNSVVDGIITIDKMGTIQSFNSACETIFGYTAEESIGQNIKFLMPEPYHSNHDFYLANYQKTGKKKIIGAGREVVGKRKDASEFPIDLSVSEILVRGQKLYTGVVRDISDRRAAEKRVKDALQFQNLISENIPDLVFVKDHEYKIVQANPAFLEMYPPEARDKVFGYTTLEEYDAEQVKEFLKHDRMALEEGYSEIEETINFPNGKTRTLFTKKTRFENASGDKFILGVSRDITESKVAEAEILRSNEELERFAYIASHDLQEPLRMVSNFTGLLNDEYGEDMSEQAQQYMKFSLDASIRMQALISDLLEYSRANEQESGGSDFNTGEQTQYALDNLQTVIQETKATIDIDDDMPIIFANPMRFSRVMQNLIGNGLKYRDADRIPKIKISCEERPKEWVFAIADNGLGIKEEYQDQVFVIFKRLHHKQEYSGTGIGLAICKKIVESFDGQLWVESEFGKGSTFFFSVPKKA